MAWTPISGTMTQYSTSANILAANYYLKFYQSGTTTAFNMATNSTGGTTLDKCQLDSSGYPTTDGTNRFIPYVDRNYKIALYTNSTDADNNTTGNADWVIDGVTQPAVASDIPGANPATLASNVTYSPAGSGAVDTNVQAKLRESVSVKDFGAVGDGVTDDSTAFTLATTHSGVDKSVYVPAGNYVATAGDFSTFSFFSYGVVTTDNATIVVDNISTRKSDKTITVGSGGDFSTINEAIKHAVATYKPAYDSTPVDVTINLLAGFVMAEQVLVSGIDLSWIQITGADAETTITNSSITASITDGAANYSSELYPAFGVTHGGSLPKIMQMFDMGFTAQDPAQKNVGVLAMGPGSTAEIGRNCGVRRCGWYGCLANYGATIYAYESDFNTSYGRGIFANESSTISAREANVNNAASTGFHSSDGSTIAAENATATGCQIGLSANNAGTINGKGATVTGCEEGILAQNGSTIHAENANASGATGGNGVGIRALGNGRINAKDANASGAQNFGVSAEKGSWINADGVNAQKGGSPASTDCRVLTGSHINFSGGTGGTSETINTLTANGIIYQ